MVTSRLPDPARSRQFDAQTKPARSGSGTSIFEICTFEPDSSSSSMALLGKNLAEIQDEIIDLSEDIDNDLTTIIQVYSTITNHLIK